MTVPAQDVRVYLAQQVLEWYDGAELDWEDGADGSGFTFNHPAMRSCS